MKERKARGRPALPKDKRMVNMNFRMTEAQKEKVKALGGGKWLRKKIDQAKLVEVEDGQG